MSLSLLLLLSLAGYASAVVDYTMWIKTAKKPYAGTNSKIEVQLFGDKGYTDWMSCSLRGIDDFRRGRTEEYRFNSQHDVGDIQCVNYRTLGSDKLLISKTVVESSGSSPRVEIMNEAGYWLSKRRGEGSALIKTCISDCAAKLPITAIGWKMDMQVLDVSAGHAKVEIVRQRVLSTVVVDAKDSDLVKESKTFYVGKRELYSIFNQTDGPYIEGSVKFLAKFATTANGTAFESLHPDTFTMGASHRRQWVQQGEYVCTAPAGKAMKCSIVMEKTRVRAPFSQIWLTKDGSDCAREVSGVFTASIDSHIMTQLNVEV